MALPQLFGVIPTGCPIITTPTTAPAPTSLLFNLPARPFSHIVVVLLPGITLPPDTAAAVYLASSPTNEGQAPEFKFLGGIGPGKESAIFKVGGTASNGNGSNAINGEVDMDAPEGPGERNLILGISVESSESVNAQMAALPSSNATLQQRSAAATPGNALVRMQDGGAQRTDALVLAQRIIKNAFNFLASFAGNVPVSGSNGTAGVEGKERPGVFDEGCRLKHAAVGAGSSIWKRDIRPCGVTGASSLMELGMEHQPWKSTAGAQNGVSSLVAEESSFIKMPLPKP
ncbi:hypothetical protein V501_04340 [Pseudogymnoascus sp. VKM F-4519 (FW-2642)]|nr:hypothetical protein V501_04340 [Pseudogymnoascus sp. VKM F-4519 (FW-2642)]